LYIIVLWTKDLFVLFVYTPVYCFDFMIFCGGGGGGGRRRRRRR
jgi:hypothetical protein